MAQKRGRWHCSIEISLRKERIQCRLVVLVLEGALVRHFSLACDVWNIWWHLQSNLSFEIRKNNSIASICAKPLFDASHNFWFQHKQNENQESLYLIDYIGDNKILTILCKRPRNRFSQPRHPHYDEQAKKQTVTVTNNSVYKKMEEKNCNNKKKREKEKNKEKW